MAQHQLGREPLRENFGEDTAWEKIEFLYSAGDYSGAAEVVSGHLMPRNVAPNPRAFQSFTRRLPLVVDNTSGGTSGLGGLTFYMGDQTYPVQNHNGTGDMKFDTRVLARGPVRCAVEILARNVLATKSDLTVRRKRPPVP